MTAPVRLGIPRRRQRRIDCARYWLDKATRYRRDGRRKMATVCLLYAGNWRRYAEEAER